MNDIPSAPCKPVAFVAELEDAEAAKRAIATMQQHQSALHHAGIHNLHFFTQQIGTKQIILATMDMLESAPAKLPENAWEIITQSALFKAAFDSLALCILPHQRHAQDPTKSPWVLTETICKIRPANALPEQEGNAWHAAVTELKQEKEAEYRLLHDNVWPAVIDAIGASNISRFDVFLIEFGDNQPHLFYLFRHTGNDFETDMASQANSPVNQRWWKFTDACQQALPAAKNGPWLAMNSM